MILCFTDVYIYSKKRFNTSRIVWESFCQGDSTNVLRNERRQMSRRLMMADAHYTRSILLSQAVKRSILFFCITKREL